MAPPLYPTHTLHLNTLSLSFSFSHSSPSFFLCIVFFFGIFIFLSSYSFSFLKKIISLSPLISLYQTSALFKSRKKKKILSTKPPWLNTLTFSHFLSHGGGKHSMVAMAWVLGFGLICILLNEFSSVLFWVDFMLGLWWYFINFGLILFGLNWCCNGLAVAVVVG